MDYSWGITREKIFGKRSVPSCSNSADCSDEEFDELTIGRNSRNYICHFEGALEKGSDLRVDTRRLTDERSIEPDFLPLLSSDFGSLNDRKTQFAATVCAVGAAVQELFGEQILNWTSYRDRAVKYGYVVTQPETSLDKLISANNYHNTDNLLRTRRFATMLPGWNEVEESAQGCVTKGWKCVVFWMIHHADFMTNDETYVTVGPQQFHYCRYWQELTSDWELIVYFYKFCTMFREIGLTQIERYLLLAVVIFEPDEDESADLKVIHRHYINVLLDVLKHRCADGAQLSAICAKIEKFFSVFKAIYALYHDYFRTGPPEPHGRTVGGLAKSCCPNSTRLISYATQADVQTLTHVVCCPFCFSGRGQYTG